MFLEKKVGSWIRVGGLTLVTIQGGVPDWGVVGARDDDVAVTGARHSTLRKWRKFPSVLILLCGGRAALANTVARYSSACC